MGELSYPLYNEHGYINPPGPPIQTCSLMNVSVKCGRERCPRLSLLIETQLQYYYKAVRDPPLFRKEAMKAIYFYSH